MITIKNLCRIVATGAFTAAMFTIAKVSVKGFKRVEKNLDREAAAIDVARAYLDAVDRAYRK